MRHPFHNEALKMYNITPRLISMYPSETNLPSKKPRSPSPPRGSHNINRVLTSSRTKNAVLHSCDICRIVLYVRVILSLHMTEFPTPSCR